MIDLTSQPSKRSRIGKSIKPRTIATFKVDLLTKRVRNYQNIGEQDRGIKTEALHRLKRYLRG